jgi:hypothetical protein
MEDNDDRGGGKEGGIALAFTLFQPDILNMYRHRLKGRSFAIGEDSEIRALGGGGRDSSCFYTLPVAHPEHVHCTV